MRVSDCGIDIPGQKIDSRDSPSSRFALECACSTHVAIGLPEPGRFAMSAVCAHANVTDPRH